MWPFNITTFGFLLISLAYSSKASSPQILVNTRYGLLKGTSSLSRNDRTVFEFLSIPYAKPPVGNLRFKAPVPPESWKGIRDATYNKPQCLQMHLISKIISGDEDCLTLNVYTHQYATRESPINFRNLKPVMFFIHGGQFMHGCGHIYKGKYFLDEDVVFVNINYRVGALGFLNMGNNEIQGNMGLKDQVMALKWVRDNIANFGGDPNSVTVFGESAGAACAHLHMLSPMSKGLFHRAISLSGTALDFWAIKKTPQKQAKHFARNVGCDLETPRKTMDCFKSLTGVQIVKGHKEAGYLLTDPLAIFGPTVESKDYKSTETFINDTPSNLIRSGKTARVPWMAGVNSEEGLIYAAPMLKNNTIRKEMNKNWNKWLPIIFGFDDEPLKKPISNKIREFYLGNAATEISMNNLEDFTKFLSDRTFYEGLHNSALLHGQNSESPLYLYLYTYKGNFSFGKVAFEMTHFMPALADIIVTSGWSWVKSNVFRMKQKHYGVCHGDELPLIFNLPMQPIHKAKSAFGTDYEMSEYLIKLYSSFAKEGKPFEKSWLPVNNAITRAISNANRNTAFPMMRLDKENRLRNIVEEPYGPRAQFWKTLNMKQS